MSSSFGQTPANKSFAVCFALTIRFLAIWLTMIAGIYRMDGESSARARLIYAQVLL